MIVPTYQRAAQVQETVRALAACRRAADVEVIVVADGCTDGTVEALLALDVSLALGVSLALNVLEQPNRGAASARNAGALVARAPVLLFLDDDMMADEHLLAAHLDRHSAAQRPHVVLGDLPVHSSSPTSVLTRGVQRWASQRRERLSVGATVASGDWLSGQVSVPAASFAEVGGFDEAFTEGSRFGGEDTDLLSRLAAAGLPIVFAPEAVSAQVYSITPAGNLRQWFDAGRADADLVRKHPGLLPEVRGAHGASSVTGRVAIAVSTSPMVRTAVVPPLRAAVLAVCDRFPASRVAEAAHFGQRQLEYWSGAAATGGLSERPRVAVLAYHAVAEHVSARLAPWTVTPSALAAHLKALTDAGLTIADPSAFLAGCRTGSRTGSFDVPDRSVLLTFDDAYADLTSVVQPLLRAHEARALTFAVPGCVGGVNAWDVVAEDDRLPLLDWAGLRQLHELGWEVGGHSFSHAHLPRLSGTELHEELQRCADAFGEQGLPRPTAFAFPYGEQDLRVRTAARRAGYDVLFGIGAPAHPGAVPRLEVQAADTPQGLRERVENAFAVRPPLPVASATLLRREAAGLARAALATLARR